MDTVSTADLAEVEKMIEAGVLDPCATRSALEYMAGRYLAEEVRKRERRLARADETTATARRERASRAVIIVRRSSPRRSRRRRRRTGRICCRRRSLSRPASA